MRWADGGYERESRVDVAVQFLCCVGDGVIYCVNARADESPIGIIRGVVCGHGGCKTKGSLTTVDTLVLVSSEKRHAKRRTVT